MARSEIRHLSAIIHSAKRARGTPDAVKMVRGNAKALAQAKNQAKKANKKEAKSDLGARAAALKTTCPICKSPMINYKQLQAHYESKHPKDTCPPEGA